MMKLIAASILIAGLPVAALAATPHSAPAHAVGTGHGKMLVDASGHTLYTYDKDAPGKSDCTLLCAAAWPPLMVKKGEKAAAGWSIVSRANGGEQWAYKGAPLYTYRLDIKAGATTGDGVDGEWHLAKP